MRIGITTGEALVDLGVRIGVGEPTVVGDVVNTAARLQTAASTDGILVNDATQRLTADSIVYRQLGDRQVKGRTAPVAVWEAVRTRSRRGEDSSREHATRSSTVRRNVPRWWLPWDGRGATGASSS